MKRRTVLLVSALGLIPVSSNAEAETWPARTLTVVVPFGAGSITDVVPRVVFEQVSKQLGQSIIVENRPGAGTTTASNLVAKSEPDGYTVLVNSSAHTIAPALYPKLAYDPARDLVAVVPLGIIPSVLVVPPSKEFRTVNDFVTAAKAKPGAMNFASAGVGTATHLSAVRFQASAGITAAHVPFKGGPESLAEVISGRVDFFFAPVGVALPHVKAGQLTALVVNTATRSAALPDVPTVSEAGFSNAEYPFWLGMFVPANTPRSIIGKLHTETLRALSTSGVRDKLAAMGVDPLPMTGPAFEAYVQQQMVSDAALVNAAGIKTQ